MNRFKDIFYRHLTTLRRSVQWTGIVMIVLIPLLNIYGVRSIAGTYYSMTVGALDIIDPSIMLQTVLLNKTATFGLLIAGIIPLLFALFFGKIFCSWLCPFNLLAEYNNRLGKYLKSKGRNRLNLNPHPSVYWVILTGIFLLIMISGIPLIVFISFPGIISAQVADALFFFSAGIELILILAVLLIELFSRSRIWCKYICPVGAVLAIPRFKHSLSVVFNSNRCAFQCTEDPSRASCNEVCPLDLNPRQAGIYPYCYHCGACVEACSKKGSRSLDFTFFEDKRKHVGKIAEIEKMAKKLQKTEQN